ncbi:MAG: hypothetical protein ACI9R3_004792 [Verrucomicrobiales bacterium]
MLDGWLKPGWQAADAETAVLESRNFLDDEKKTVTVEFGDDGENGLAGEPTRAAAPWKR